MIANSSTASQDRSGPQQSHDRIGQRDRAQREFLALVDVVLDEDAARRQRRGLSARSGSNSDHPGHHHQQHAGAQESNEHPHAALGPLEMIEQHRQHQQLRGRADRIEPRTPGASDHSVPTSASTNSAIGSAADRPLQRAQERPASRGSAPSRSAAPRAKIATSDVDHGSDDRDQDRDHIDRCHPGAGSRQRRQQRRRRRCRPTALTPCPRGRDRPATSC